MSIDNLTDEELAAELERRKQRKEQEEKPKQLETIDITSLRAICQEYIDTLASGGYVSDDFDHYIYEAAIEAVFGTGVWGWINKRL